MLIQKENHNKADRAIFKIITTGIFPHIDVLNTRVTTIFDKEYNHDVLSDIPQTTYFQKTRPHI